MNRARPSLPPEAVVFTRDRVRSLAVTYARAQDQEARHLKTLVEIRKAFDAIVEHNLVLRGRVVELEAALARSAAGTPS